MLGTVGGSVGCVTTATTTTTSTTGNILLAVYSPLDGASEIGEIQKCKYVASLEIGDGVIRKD